MGIQSVKTQIIRPLEPQERDILSVYNMIYEPLVRIDDEYKPSPCLAESWESANDGRTWTFHIRTGVTFSDGTPLTAQDVVDTANAILERASDETASTKGYYGNLRYFVSRITATGTHTVVVRTPANRSYYGVLYAMSFPILPSGQANADEPVGSGPYIIADFNPGEYILLERNINWWRSPPQVETITFLCHETQREVVESYEYGRVNTIFTRSVAAAQYRSGSTSLSIDYRTSQLEVLLMHHYGRLASANVRKAIRYVVDPDYLAQHVYLNMVTRTDTPMIPGTWTYNDSLGGYFVRNLDEARRLLEEDGWGDSDEDGILDKLNENDQKITLSLNLLVYEEPDNDVRIQAANAIRDELAQVGIEVTVVVDTFTSVKTKLEAGNFQLALAAYSMDPCPDPGFMLISGNTYNYCRYRSTAMTDLCNQLRRCEDQGSYQDTLYQIQERFAQDCPFICLYYRDGVALTRYMYTTIRDVREYDLLRGIETFRP